MKLAIIISSDPKNGEEALGRAFNALALAAEGQTKGDEVNILSWAQARAGRPNSPNSRIPRINFITLSGRT